MSVKIVDNKQLFDDPHINVSLATYQGPKRIFYVAMVKTKTRLTNEAIMMWVAICENLLKSATEEVYVNVDVRETELLSIQQLKLVANELDRIRPLIEKSLRTTIMTMSNETFLAKGLIGTLKTFFQSVYVPVKPVEFCLDGNTLEDILTTYELKEPGTQ